MREVKVDALDMRVLGGDHVEGGTNATTDIDEHLNFFEALVKLQEFLGGDDRVVLHALIEHLVESGVGAMILECCHTISLVEGNSPIQHRILEVVPVFVVEGNLTNQS